MKRVLTVVGTRPQFVKAAVVSRAFAENAVEETLVHTGQHYDAAMSDVFFEEMEIPRPKRNLQIGGGSHGAMTGRMLQLLEEVLLQERPDAVLVYGDTNTTLAGALAASKLALPVLHVEAGLRSWTRHMPEEINRRVADHLSAVLFCPTEVAVANLSAEGICDGVHLVGDVLLDAVRMFTPVAQLRSTVLQRAGLGPRDYVLATVHRAANVDDPAPLAAILRALQRIAAGRPVVMPLHPRTRDNVQRFGLQELLHGLLVMEPLGFLDMLMLEQSARAIVTDSGGVQKEAFFFGVPCVTLREETEWTETVDSGWNRLAGSCEDRIVAACEERWAVPAASLAAYGDGMAARHIERIVSAL